MSDRSCVIEPRFILKADGSWPGGVKAVKQPLYPINVWAYQAKTWRLFNFCESLHEALDCAKKLPYTPVVLSTKRDLPFSEQLLSESEFGELTNEERFASGLQ